MKMEHGEYIKRRDELLKIRSDSFDSFDTTVLSLATGSLALSITFLDKIGYPFSLFTYFLIVMMWIGLIITICSNLLSYIFAKWNMDNKIKELDNNYRNGIDIETIVEKTFWQRAATNWCNNIAAGAFFVSIFFFSWYIMKIQWKSYIDTVEIAQQKKEDLNMGIKKTAGKTEVKAASGETRHTDGQTEMPAAQPGTKGQTETPQAVQKPSQSGTTGNPGKK